MSQPLRCEADFPELLWKDCQAKLNELCDVEIVVGTRNFWCHGSILAASSEFFRSAYNPSASGVKTIRLSSIPGGPHVFELVRRFLYGQDFTVTDATVLDVWQAADFLGTTPRKPDGVSLQARCKSVWDSRVQHSWRSCLHLLCKAAKLGSITDVHPSDRRLAECKKRFLLLVGSHLVMGAVLRNLVKLKAGHVEQLLSILKDVRVLVPAAELSQNMMAYLMDLVCYFKAGSPPSDKVGANIISVCEFVLDYLQCATGAYRRAPGSFLRSGTGQAPAVIYLAMVAHTCYVLNPGRYARSNFDTVLTLVGPLDIGCLTPEALAEWVQPFFPTSETGFPVRSKIGELRPLCYVDAGGEPPGHLLVLLSRHGRVCVQGLRESRPALRSYQGLHEEEPADVRGAQAGVREHAGPRQSVGAEGWRDSLLQLAVSAQLEVQGRGEQ
ncbi:uncharacterized protein LOC112341620 [Selaginella moellendorffii]|uniref:uncharacterized protein LOC112341620 n=1 Tax=Selaginella moellendorffii TaxID=88036 RepID=UPI000D1CEC1A|nr:uncharacterized protein LOC112341620 [Selaginella moellendorffii]|eukprot:XP_024517835.1 uncharacterized protein LOC112341620 [Selaginella moellendorffii]